MERKAVVERKTKETQISLSLNMDGTGKARVATGIAFLDHMFTLLAAHGLLDLELKASGDIEVDYHHTVEDLGICLGMAINQALGNRAGIRRYGDFAVPMDEAVARVVMDLSNRPYLSYNVAPQNTVTGRFDISLLKEFFRALVNNSGITLHVDLVRGDDPHHVSEAIFKAFGRALDQACTVDERIKEQIPSTKGVL